MKKYTFSFLVLPLLMLIFTACTTTKTEDVEDAAQEVDDAQTKLDQANKEYAEEVASYRMSIESDIANNKVLIETLKAEKSATKAIGMARNAEIDVLQKRNAEMEERMNNYKEDDKDHWSDFKSEFSHDMDELGKAFKDLSVNNVK